jgi:uncharacterized protein YwgA
MNPCAVPNQADSGKRRSRYGTRARVRNACQIFAFHDIQFPEDTSHSGTARVILGGPTHDIQHFCTMTANSSGNLPLENGTDLLILLLYTPGHTKKEGEPIEGITRLQKLMFLLRQGLGPGKMVDLAKMYGYKPYKMGPYSDELGRDLEELIAAGIIRGERLEYWIRDDADEMIDIDPDVDMPTRRKRKVESIRYSLTPDLGMQIGGDLWGTLGLGERRELGKFKAFFNGLSLRQLLIFAYERFPEFATESVIKSQLGLS